MIFFLQTLIAVAQLIAGFYGFWLVWRVFLPLLPGPSDPEERIARFDRYFTDPLVLPLSRMLHVHPRMIAMILLFVLAAGQVALAHLSQSL